MLKVLEPRDVEAMAEKRIGGDERAYGGMEEHSRKQQSQQKVPYVRRPPWALNRGLLRNLSGGGEITPKLLRSLIKA